MASAFERFLANRRDDLHRISRQTRGEHTLEDVTSEAWLMAIDIAHRRGWAFDYASEDDQNELFARLYLRLVKYTDKNVRYAIKLDHGNDDDSERTGATLARLLTAPLDTDPQIRRQLIEEREEFVDRIQRSYSQAAAFALLLMRVDGHVADLADLLWIGVSTLRERMKRAGLLARIQPTLFDGIERIELDFQPWRRPRFGPCRNCEEAPSQLSLLA